MKKWFVGLRKKISVRARWGILSFLPYFGLLVAAGIVGGSMLYQRWLPANSANILKTSTRTCYDGFQKLLVTAQYPNRLAPNGTNLFRLPMYLSIAGHVPASQDYDLLPLSTEKNLLFTDANGVPITLPLLVPVGRLGTGVPQVVYVQRVEQEVLPANSEITIMLYRQDSTIPLSCGLWSEPVRVEFMPRGAAALSLWLEKMTRPEVLPVATVLTVVGLWLQQSWKRRDVLRDEMAAFQNRVKALRAAINTNVMESMLGWSNEENRLNSLENASDVEEAHIAKARSRRPETRIALQGLKEEILSAHWKEPLLQKIFDCYTIPNGTSDEDTRAEDWVLLFAKLQSSQDEKKVLDALVKELEKIAAWRKGILQDLTDLNCDQFLHAYKHFGFDCHRPMADLMALLVQEGLSHKVYETFSKEEVGRNILLDQVVRQAALKLQGAKSEGQELAIENRLPWLPIHGEAERDIQDLQRKDLEKQFPCGTESTELDPDITKFLVELPCFPETLYLQQTIVIGQPGSGKTTAAYWLAKKAHESNTPPHRVFAAYSGEQPLDVRRWMLDTMAGALRRFIGRNPLHYLLAGPDAQSAIETLLWTEARDRANLLFELTRAGLNESKDGKCALHKITSKSVLLHDSISIPHLAEIIGQALPAQFGAVFLILDLPPGEIGPEVSQNLQQLFFYWPALSRQQVYLKIFVPVNWVGQYKPSIPHQVPLNWPEDRLTKLIENWRGSSRDFLQVACGNDSDRKAFLTKRLVCAARGSPRRLVRLANRLAKYQGMIDDKVFDRITHD